MTSIAPLKVIADAASSSVAVQTGPATFPFLFGSSTTCCPSPVNNNIPSPAPACVLRPSSQAVTHTSKLSSSSSSFCANSSSSFGDSCAQKQLRTAASSAVTAAYVSTRVNKEEEEGEEGDNSSELLAISTLSSLSSNDDESDDNAEGSFDANDDSAAAEGPSAPSTYQYGQLDAAASTSSSSSDAVARLVCDETMSSSSDDVEKETEEETEKEREVEEENGKRVDDQRYVVVTRTGASKSKLMAPLPCIHTCEGCRKNKGSSDQSLVHRRTIHGNNKVGHYRSRWCHPKCTQDCPGYAGLVDGDGDHSNNKKSASATGGNRHNNLYPRRTRIDSYRSGNGEEEEEEEASSEGEYYTSADEQGDEDNSNSKSKNEKEKEKSFPRGRCNCIHQCGCHRSGGPDRSAMFKRPVQSQNWKQHTRAIVCHPMCSKACPGNSLLHQACNQRGDDEQEEEEEDEEQAKEGLEEEDSASASDVWLTEREKAEPYTVFGTKGCSFKVECLPCKGVVGGFFHIYLVVENVTKKVRGIFMRQRELTSWWAPELQNPGALCDKFHIPSEKNRLHLPDVPDVKKLQRTTTTPAVLTSKGVHRMTFPMRAEHGTPEKLAFVIDTLLPKLKALAPKLVHPIPSAQRSPGLHKSSSPSSPSSSTTVVKGQGQRQQQQPDVTREFPRRGPDGKVPRCPCGHTCKCDPRDAALAPILHKCISINHLARHERNPVLHKHCHAGCPLFHLILSQAAGGVEVAASSSAAALSPPSSRFALRSRGNGYVKEEEEGEDYAFWDAFPVQHLRYWGRDYKEAAILKPSLDLSVSKHDLICIFIRLGVDKPGHDGQPSMAAFVEEFKQRIRSDDEHDNFVNTTQTKPTSSYPTKSSIFFARAGSKRSAADMGDVSAFAVSASEAVSGSPTQTHAISSPSSTSPPKKQRVDVAGSSTAAAAAPMAPVSTSPMATFGGPRPVDLSASADAPPPSDPSAVYQLQQQQQQQQHFFSVPGQIATPMHGAVSQPMLQQQQGAEYDVPPPGMSEGALGMFFEYQFAKQQQRRQQQQQQLMMLMMMQQQQQQAVSGSAPAPADQPPHSTDNVMMS